MVWCLACSQTFSHPRQLGVQRSQGTPLHPPNCNPGNLKTNQQGEYGTMKVWIANIFLMNELKIISHHLQQLGRVLCGAYPRWTSEVLQRWKRTTVHWPRRLGGGPGNATCPDGVRGSSNHVRTSGMTEFWGFHQERGSTSQGGKTSHGINWEPKQKRLQGNGEQQHDYK